MDRGSIPGFWYDEEKRKYFKILPNHVAPTGVEYSKEGVTKRKKREEEVEKDAKLQTFKQRTEIRRARISKSFYGATLGREIGLTSCSRVTAATTFARTMRMQYRMDLPTSYGIGDHLSTGIRVSSILRDDYTSIVFTGYQINDTGTLIAWNSPVNKRRSWNVICVDAGTEITYLCSTPSRLLVKTTMGGPTKGASIDFIRWLPDPSGAFDDGLSYSNSAHVNFTLNRRPRATIWDCSPCLDPSDPGEVALGTSRGVLFASPQRVQYMDPGKWSVPSHDTASSVLAVRWLSPYLLSAGFRNGQVQLFDKRVQKHVATWQHPSTVASIRAADEYRFVVAGLQDQLHTYDARYKAPDILRPYASPGNKPIISHTPVTLTPPYISYPSYRNTAYLRIGFDVSPQLNLIAAYQESGGITLLDVWTGKEVVTSWQDSEWNEDKPSKDIVQQLVFFGMEASAKRIWPNSDSGLLVARGRYFEEWHL